MATFSLHPLLDKGISKTPTPEGFAGGKLRCHCATNPVEVTLTSNVLHNHACGCSKCWKPKGALFSIVGVVPVSNLSVSDPASKLAVIDETATIKRYACKDCGVHLYGRIEKEHAFKGLDFVHTELAENPDAGWQPPQFAAFVSSVLEQGLVRQSEMDEVRARLRAVGLEPYDALSPPLMDALAAYEAKKKGVLRE